MNRSEPTIKQLELVNFMCHSNLKINFKRRLTLISGLNGSGKSAIMIAIGILLGQRASKLERGNSYKDLIKTGEIKSTIRIILNNKNERFRNDFFGDEIYVEKRISTTSSSLVIFNESKRVWSKKNLDLERVICHFGLHFENPLNFMTQEAAKKFLNTSKPEILYSLFMKGTGIEDTKLLHVITENKAAEMKDKIDVLRKQIEILDKEIKKKEDKMAFILTAKECENQLEELFIEKEWSKIDYSFYKNKKKELEDCDQKILRFGRELGIAKKEEEDLIMEETRINQENITIKNDNFKKIRDINENIFTEERKKREIENDLKEIVLNIENNKNILLEQEKMKNIDDIETKKDELSRKVNELNEKQVEKLNIERKLEHLKLMNESQQEKIETTKTQINIVKRQIEENRKIKINNLSFFNSNMHLMVEDIKRQKFNNIVIGPIGNEVRLKEKKWYKPVSIVLKRFLGSFIVFDQKDKQKIIHLLNKHGINNSSIYMPSNKSTNLMKYESNKSYLTLLDVLEIKDPIVTNQLILLCSIEQIILVEQRNEAHKIIKSNPQNVEIAFTIHGDQIKMFNNCLTDFSQSKNNERYFFENSSDKIAELESKLIDLRKINLTNAYKNEYNDKKTRYYTLENEISHLTRDITGLSNSIKVLDDLRDNYFKEDVEKIKENIQANQAQKNELDIIFTEINNKILRSNRLISELKGKNEMLGTNEDLQRRKKNIEYKIYEIQQLHTNEKNFLYKLENELDITEKKIKAYEKTLEEQYKKSKPLSIRKTSEIDVQIYNLQAKIQMCKKSGKEEDILKEIEEDKMIKEIKEKTISENYKTIDKLIQNAKDRIKKREEIKNNESKRAAYEFKNYMIKRNYEGSLVFDHERMSLEMKVKLAHNVCAGDKNTLSGGERSFSGIAFLLSLWPSVVCPVKILDEFDVYMDTLNRKCALKEILNYFKTKQSQVNQIIIISPLDINDVFEENCEVIVLEPPREKKQIK